MEYEIGLVLYTDGSARPNPGDTGCGIHGYKYTTAPATRGTGLSTQALTRIGYKPKHLTNDIKAAGGEVTPVKYYDIVACGTKNESNNAAEIDAMYHALCNISMDEIQRIYFLVDSEYVRRGILEWLDSWKRANWTKRDGSPVSNKDRWLLLDSKLNEVRGRGIEVEVAWVKGHGIDHGNNIADILSVIGTMQMKNNDHKTKYKESEPNGYWKSDVSKHPMISHQKCYFNSLAEHNIPGHYYLSEPTGADLTCGRKSPEASYAAIRITESDKIMELIKEKQYEAAGDINSIVVMRLENAFNSTIYSYLQEYGKNAFLTELQRDMSVKFVNKTVLTQEVNPVGNTFRAVEVFGELEDVIEEYKAATGAGAVDPQYGLTGFAVHDVTDTFYRTIEKKKGKDILLLKELKPEYGVGHKVVEIPLDINHNTGVKKLVFPITLGLDLPPRNNLKRMEDLNPRVSIVTWFRSPQIVQYMGIIETDDAIGVWTNYFAGRVVMKS